MSTKTIFHKIVTGEIPAYVISEDENHIAFLDIFPSRRGQVVVIPKTHTTSKFTEANESLIQSTMHFAKQVGKKIESKLDGVNRVFVVIEGLGVDYFHVKLYPSYGDDELTHMGAKATDEELIALQKELK